MKSEIFNNTIAYLQIRKQFKKKNLQLAAPNATAQFFCLSSPMFSAPPKKSTTQIIIIFFGLMVKRTVLPSPRSKRCVLSRKMPKKSLACQNHLRFRHVKHFSMSHAGSAHSLARHALRKPLVPSYTRCHMEQVLQHVPSPTLCRSFPRAEVNDFIRKFGIF